MMAAQLDLHLKSHERDFSADQALWRWKHHVRDAFFWSAVWLNVIGFCAGLLLWLYTWNIAIPIGITITTIMIGTWLTWLGGWNL